jgi:hypothetical protein
MTYSLTQLAPGAYDLLLNGEVMGSVVRHSSRQPYTWTAELLEHRSFRRIHIRLR